MHRHAIRSDTEHWRGWTLGQLRAFVADHAETSDDTLLIAVTREGTAGLWGVGFFSMSDARPVPSQPSPPSKEFA
jgi:hypothetical protein